MERSGPDDAWDDGGEPAYPPAPLPAHERTWRHPSEVGKAAWELSEPPVAIGRGLLVTTGAIGSVLGVAVLWLLSPMGGGSPAAAPVVTQSSVVVRTTEVAAPTTDERLIGSTVAARPLDPIDLTDFTLPAEDVPSTVLVAAPHPEGHTSIAVAVGTLPYMLTTATAVSVDERRTTVDIVAPGDPVAADVVSIDGELAYLQPSSAIEVVSFDTVSTAQPGQTVVVLTDEPTEVTYRADGTVPELDPNVIVEGTPVIDDDGSLVALCTVVIDESGAFVDLVPVVPVTEPTDSSSTSSDPSTTDDATVGTDPTTDPTTTSSVPPITSTTIATPSSVATTAGSGSGSGAASTGSSPSSTATTTSPTNTSTNGGTATTVSGTSSSTTIATVSAWAGLRFDTGAVTPLVVAGLPAGSPAASAGIAVGDRIVAVDGVAVTSLDDLLVQVRKHVPGDVVVFRVASASGATERSVSVSLGAASPTV